MLNPASEKKRTGFRLRLLRTGLPAGYAKAQPPSPRTWMERSTCNRDASGDHIISGEPLHVPSNDKHTWQGKARQQQRGRGVDFRRRVVAEIGWRKALALPVDSGGLLHAEGARVLAGGIAAVQERRNGRTGAEGASCVSRRGARGRKDTHRRAETERARERAGEKGRQKERLTLPHA